MNAVIDTIMARRSIRAYTDAPVDRATLEEVLRATTYAPSGGNRQVWRIVAVTNPAINGRVTEAVRGVLARRQTDMPPSWKFGFGAPVVIHLALPREHPIAQYDAGCAAQTLFLAAASLGLSTCWLSLLASMSDEPEVRPLLTEIGIPETYVVHFSTPLGYAADTKPASPRKEGTTAIYD